MLFLSAMALAADLSAVATQQVIFPGMGLDLGVEVVECEAKIALAEDGAPAQVEVPRTTQCPEPFALAIEVAVGGYRYPPGEAGRSTTESFKWRLKSTAWPTMTPAELEQIIAAHETLPLAVDGCEIRLRVAVDGGIEQLRSSEVPRCLVLPLGPARNPPRLRRQETKPVLCTARFTSDRGVASDVDLSECPERWQLPADIALRNWQWQTGPDLYEQYTVRFVFSVE